jgi:hypothetical protein
MDKCEHTEDMIEVGNIKVEYEWLKQTEEIIQQLVKENKTMVQRIKELEHRLHELEEEKGKYFE